MKRGNKKKEAAVHLEERTREKPEAVAKQKKQGGAYLDHSEDKKKGFHLKQEGKKYNITIKNTPKPFFKKNEKTNT